LDKIGNIRFAKQGVVSLSNDRGTKYSKYIEIQNEVVRAYNELRNELSRQAFGDKFDEITEAQRKLVQEISAASMEMNSGSGQVNNALQQLNQVTQQNAAASEEMATGSEELSGQADELKQTVSFFNIGNEYRKISSKKKNTPKVESFKQTGVNMSKHASQKQDNGDGVKLDMFSGSSNDDEFENF